MSKELARRKGAILFWRLGEVEFGEQSRWAGRAPTSKGLWAFPWPYFEMFYAYHRYSYLMPKRLKLLEGTGWPAHPCWYQDLEGNPLGKLPPLDENGRPAGDDFGLREGFWEEQEEWVATVGKKILPLRKFWYEGDLYTHISPRGQTGNSMAQFGEINWFKCSTQDFAKRVTKSRGDKGFPTRVDGRVEPPLARYAHDHLEVFIPAGAGRITSPKR